MNYEHSIHSVSAEQELINGCIAQNQAIQKKVYEKYASKMYYVCLRYVKNPDDAKDLMHESFIKFFQTIGSFKQNCSLETWISRITVNHTLTFLKKRNKNRFFSSEYIENNDFIDENEEDDFSPYQSVTPEKLLEVITNLPEGYRTVLNLYAFENFSHKQIAESLGISEGTSKSQLARARKMLKSVLDKHLKFEML